MKRIITTAFAMVLVSGAAFASADFSCTVGTVNAAGNTFSCASPMGTMNIAYNDQTVFTSNGQPATEANLSTGDAAGVDVSPNPAGGMTVVSVALTETAPTPPTDGSGLKQSSDLQKSGGK